MVDDRRSLRHFLMDGQARGLRATAPINPSHAFGRTMVRLVEESGVAHKRHCLRLAATGCVTRSGA